MLIYFECVELIEYIYAMVNALCQINNKDVTVYM